MSPIAARAKINLALVVGPLRPDGKHEVTTVYQRLALADDVTVAPAGALGVDGFGEDTIVRRALEVLAAAADVEPAWAARITKRIPVAAGLGGGSSDAAAALLAANALLVEPVPAQRLHELATELGADVPFFLSDGPQLGEGDGSVLTPLTLPQDYTVVLVVPHGVTKSSTGAIYEDFDLRAGPAGYPDRRAALLAGVDGVASSLDLARLPSNDLASSPLIETIEELGAFRADVSGAGPTVYGLFADPAVAQVAAAALAGAGAVFVTAPSW